MPEHSKAPRQLSTQRGRERYRLQTLTATTPLIATEIREPTAHAVGKMRLATPPGWERPAADDGE
jgi:hypothetical protein